MSAAGLSIVAPSRATDVPLVVAMDGARLAIGRLWFDGDGRHSRLSFGRLKPTRPLTCPMDLAILARLPDDIPDGGLADAVVIGCRGLALTDLYLVKQAVLTASLPMWRRSRSR